MSVRNFVLLFILVLQPLNLGWAGTIREIINSNPSGADIYWGKSESNIDKTRLKTPHTRTIEASAWESWCYQVKKEGYHDSKIECRPKEAGDRRLFFVLKRNPESLLGYLERQKTSSKLDPADSLFDEAYELFEKAKATCKYPASFLRYGTSDREGIRLLEQAIEINPSYHAAYYALGLSFLNIEEFNKFEKCFLKCIELKPKHETAYSTLAYQYKKIKRYDESLRYYKKFLNVGNPNIWTYANIGDIYLEKKELENAEVYYNEMRNFADEVNITPGKYAKLFLLKGDLKSSWNELKKTTSSNVHYDLETLIYVYTPFLLKNDFYALISVGRIYFYSGVFEKAIEYLEKALDLNPIEFDQHYELGFSYQAGSEYQKAIKYFEKAIEINPNHYASHLKLGEIYGLNKSLAAIYNVEYDYKKAIQLLNKAIEINSTNADPYYFLAQVHHNANENYYAIREAKKALEISKEDRTYSLLGEIYSSQGENIKALEYYEKALNLIDNWFNKYNVVNSLIKLKEYDRSIVLLNESLAKDSVKYTSETDRFMLGNVYSKKGEHKNAISNYKMALELGPKNFDATFGIASSYFNLKNYDEAIKWWLKAVELRPNSSASLFNIGLSYFYEDKYENALKFFIKTLEKDNDNAEANKMIKTCNIVIESVKFPDKIKGLSYKENLIGCLAKLILCSIEYDKANNLFIEGRSETKYKEGKNIVSPKIYESLGYFEKLQFRIQSIPRQHGLINESVVLLKSAIAFRIKGINLISQGYYKKKSEYQGEYEKGLAKIKLADTDYTDFLKLLKRELKKHISEFGQYAINKTENDIVYYENKYK